MKSSSAKPATGPLPGPPLVLRLDGGVVSHIRIGLTNLAATALRAVGAEDVLRGHPLTEATIPAAADAAMAICDPSDDLRGDREYETAMAGQMVKRALHAAAARCH
jgi:carbon-monoxide dehydrogenase medium subunit